MNILETCDIVVDVGGKYDPSKHYYDHHMRYGLTLYILLWSKYDELNLINLQISDFAETLSTVIKKPGYDSQIKLSSAGLVYCHFGHEIIKQLVPQASDNDIELIFKQVYHTLIKEIDGIDNGIPMYKEEPL